MNRGRTGPGQLFVNLLGGFQVTGPTATDALLLERKKTHALLAMLALDPGSMVPRGKITAVLWAEQSEDTARHALRQCLFDLRRVLARAGLQAIRVEADLIGLEQSRVIVDVARFGRQVARGTPEALQEAVTLYRGDLLEGFSLKESTFEEWLRAEREGLRSQAVGAMKKLLAHHLAQITPDAALQVALRLLALEPFDEAVHRTLMRLYAESGRRSAALQQYEECVELLGRELGVEPDAETRDLYRRLMAGRAKATNAPVPNGAQRGPLSRGPKRRVRFRSNAQTPLVGRDADLAWLDSSRHTARQGKPQLLLVVGEAGIGKSRLLEELAARAQSHRGDVLLGRGREGESILPFAPWTEMLRPVLAAGIASRLPLAIRRDLARLFPEIADGPSSPGGLEDGLRIFEALACLLRELAAEQPLVVILEDLHWCDDMTVRLLRFLPRRLEGRPVLLVGTARPEEIAEHAGGASALKMLCRDTSCLSLTVKPLSRSETAQLFQTLLTSRGQAPSPELVERVWRLSEGNPFVVVECARAVRDRGDRGGDAWLDLPDQVWALTGRCFTGLSDRAARLTDVASIIGRDFDVAVLGHAAGLAAPEVADGVEELVRRLVLREVDGRFDFRHDRVREAAYRRLLGPRRALLHRQVAEALESVYAAEIGAHYAAIGAHYREAGVWEPAGQYLARAGFQAWERAAGREALACFENALEAVGRLPDTEERRELRVHLRLAANGAHVATASYEAGLPHLLVAEKLAESLPDRRWSGRVAAALTNSYRAAGALAKALRVGQSALDIARETGDRGLQSAATFVLAYTECTAGHFRRSANLARALLTDDAQSPGLEGPFLPYVDKPVWMRALGRYIVVLNYVQLGALDAGMRLVEEAFREVDMSDDPLGTSQMFANISLGKLNTARGEFAGAVHAFEAAMAIYREDCHRNYYRPLGWGLGLSYAMAGRVSEGVDLLERAEAAERTLGSKSFSEMLNLHLGRAYIAAGRLDDAALRASNALEVARVTGNRQSEAGAHGLLGEVARFRDAVDHEAMERHVLDALTIAEALEMRPLMSRCHLRLAWLYERAGRREHAQHAATATALLEQMGNPRCLDAVGVH